MTTSTPPDNAVLVLRPPMINGQTKLVVGAHIGVPLVAYDLVTDGEGAVVLVDPPLSGTMDPDDVMELWLEDEVTALDSKTIEDPNVRTTLRIPKGRLHPDKVNKLYYTVRRGSANRGTSTPSLEILYNRIRPGFKDRLTDPGGHSELQLLLPDVIKNGVGPDFVSAEVCVAYPYCRAYDLITLKCNGELLDPKPKVNPNQAPQPPNPGDEPPITICFTITRAYLDKAKRLDKKLHFSYTVTDQIGNGPDTDTPWSPVQSVDEDLDGTRLPMPILLERKEDFPGDDASIIDLEKLAGNPLLVVVLTTDNRFVVGYDVIATYTATNTGQPADVVVTVPGKVEADPFGVKQTLFLEVPNDKVFAGSDVTVTYELRKPNGDLAGNSQVAHARVTGVRLDLKPPSIKEAPNGTSLDPFAGKDTLTAVVDYVGMLLNDEIIVTFSGAPGTPDGGSHITAPWTVSTLGPQNIPLDNTVIAFNLGQSVAVSYTVARGSDDPKDSKTRTLEVLPIKNEDNRLPDPVINGITSAELDVTTLPGQPRTRIAAWLLLALKQTLWLRYFVEGNPTPISTTYNGALIPPDGVPGGMQPYTPVAELNKLADGAKLRIEFKVGFDGSTDESKAVVFPSRVYTVKALATPLQPSLKEAAGSNSLNPFAAKDTLTVVVPHYTGMAGTDQISVTWTGAAGTPAGGSHTSTAVEVGTVGEKEIPIPNTVVAFNLGKPVTVFYTVIRNGTPTKSEEFTLNVQAIPNEDSRLPNPIINANTTSELDVTTLPANAQTRIAAWTLIKQGQKLWMRYFVEGNPTPISTTYNGDSVPAGAESSGMYPNTPVNELKALANGARLRTEFKIAFDSDTNEATAVMFPVRTYTVSVVPQSVPTFINSPYTVAPAGRLKTIELLLSTSSNTPVPQGKLSLTLPANFMYADGGSGQREFVTDDVGRLSVSGVKGGHISGSYSLSAASGSQTASATVTVMELGPVGIIPVVSNPFAIAVNPDGTRAYVGNINRGHAVSVIDTATNQVLTNIPVGNDPYGIAFNPDGTRAYVCNIGSNTVSVIDTATNQVLTNIPVGSPYFITVSPGGTRAYVSNYRGGTVSVIDTATNGVLTSIPVGSSPMGIAVSPDGTRVYASNSVGGTVSVIDTATNRVLTNIPVGSPYHITVSPDGTRVYVVNFRSHTVSVIDTATNRVLTNIPVGNGPFFVAVSPDGTRAYVSNISDSTVSVFDTATNRVLATMPGPDSPHGIALSPDGTRAYVSSFYRDAVSVIGTATN